MRLPQKCIATNALRLLAVLALFCNAALAFAASVAGTVTHLSGPLLARKADGAVKVLSVKSTVEQGDTLVSEKDTYARIKFIDNSEITLRPNSQFKIDSFAFDEEKQENDSAVFNLVKGGLRAVTGLVGKRSKERFGLNTPTATIGIRGTIFIVEFIPPDQPPAAAYGRASVAAVSTATIFPAHFGSIDTPRSDVAHDMLPVIGVVPLQLAQNVFGGTTPAVGGGRAPGLYVQVLDGMINLTNKGGTQNFSAGQFGYTPSVQQPPVVLPANPGIQFTPPPSFSSTTGPQGSTGSSGKQGSVDCEVR